jgi:hypothetical protein
MRQDANHREVFAKPESLGDDFALIFEAFADAFRGLGSGLAHQCGCKATLHFAGWR